MIFVTLLVTSILFFLIAQWFDGYTDRKRSVWIVYAIPLLLYILCYGLRDGWFQDYVVYENVYLHPFLESDYEIFFRVINSMMRFIGLPVWCAMTVYVTFFVIGSFWLFTLKREYLGIAMAILVTLNVWGLGMLVRWFFACGILYAAYRYMIMQKWWIAIVLFFLSCCVHFPIILVGIIAVIVYYVRPFRNVYVNIVLLVLSLMLSQEMLASSVLFIVEHLNIFPQSLHVTQYIDDPKLVDYFFSGDNLGITEEFTFLHALRLFIYYTWFIIWGWLIVKKENAGLQNLSYQMFVLSAVLYFPTEGFELMMRFETAFLLVVAPLMASVIVGQFNKGYWIAGGASVGILILNFLLTLKGILAEYNLKYITI